MVGFFKLKSDALADQVATGEAIMRVSKSAFKDTAAWEMFNVDIRGGLPANGQGCVGHGAGPNGEIPDSVEIVPVYDTPNRMHVRIPWSGLLKTPPKVEDEPSYGGPQNVRFKVLLARYFMRHCR